MAIAEEILPIIIEPSEKFFYELRIELRRSGIKKVAIINIFSMNMNSEFVRVKKLIDDNSLLKIFHGGSLKIFNDMIENFNLRGRDDLKYLKILDITKVVFYYWNHYYKNFCPTVSGREENFGEEI